MFCNIFIGVVVLSGYHVASLPTQFLRRAPSTAKLTLAEWPSYNIRDPNGPGTYAFGYEIDDPATKNVQFRDEEKLANGTVLGSYGITRSDGMVTVTRYIADDGGYRANTQTFNSFDAKRPTILTTPPPQRVEQPNGIGFIDINPEVISADVAQQILDKDEHSGEQLTGGSDDQLASTYFDQVFEDAEDNENENTPSTMNTTTVVTNLESLQEILTGQRPFTISKLTNDKNQTVGVQFVNNYIPQNFQLIPFILPKEFYQQIPKEQPESVLHDPVDEEVPFVNDKFHDPLDSRRKLNKFRKGSNRKSQKVEMKSVISKLHQLIQQQQQQPQPQPQPQKQKQRLASNRLTTIFY